MINTNFLTICPACRNPTLHRIEIEPLLPSYHCEHCGGEWIRGGQYLCWVEHPDRQSGATRSIAAASHVHDSTRALLCPECGKLLARFRVGHGLSFFIDHCAGCGGVWLDANEWEALKSIHLEDRIHRIFSAAWQAQILREQQEQMAEHRLAAQIGQDGFEQLQRMTRWIASHPHRAELTAYLMEHLGRRTETREGAERFSTSKVETREGAERLSTSKVETREGAERLSTSKVETREGAERLSTSKAPEPLPSGSAQ